MIDVGAVAAELWDRFLTASQRDVIAHGLGLPVQEARRVVAFLAGLHDLGKLTPHFQCCEPSARLRVAEELLSDMGPAAPVGHARASMHVGLGLLAELGFALGGNDSPAVRAAQCLGGHHGRFLQVDVDQAASTGRVNATLGGPLWQDLRRRYTHLLWHLFGAEKAPGRMTAETSVLITGLTMLADRLASRRRFWLPNAHMPAFGAHEHYTRARHQARQAVEDSGLARFTLEKSAFTTVHGGVGEPNEAQASVLEQMPAAVAARGSGIVVVTDATGSGKSVTALELARIFGEHCGTRGVLWLLPTTAAADAAYGVLDRYVRAHRPETAPITLVHSASGLNDAYIAGPLALHGDSAPGASRERAAEADGTGGIEDQDEGEAAGEGEAGPEEWLRSWDNALLAQFTVATVDQAQMAVLPVRHSALRLLAMTGKTVIVDEAHALTPFSQLQLCRLLNWLGALGSPVVLLSATLPASTGADLVRAYLTGVGHTTRALNGRVLAPTFPGWLFADAATACTTHMDKGSRARHMERQRRPVRVEIRDVIHRGFDPGRPAGAGERLAVITETLGPVLHGGGCAAVVCATVSDAQDTYEHLRRTWTGAPGEMLLVHARVGDRRRERDLSRRQRLLGPAGPRPGRLIVVTTSLLDMSLNIDVDLMVSDLASLSRLLQRAGRLGRFSRQWAAGACRPGWWNTERGPCLTVLHPVNSHGATALPPGWRRLEPAAVVHATAHLLKQRTQGPLSLPDDVQDLVEAIHGATSPFASEVSHLRDLLAGHRTRLAAEQHLSAVHLVPPPRRVSSLADLHRQYLTTAQAATRLGTLSRRLLPCYRTADGTLAFDAAGRHPLPDQQNLGPKHIRSILEHSLPVPAAWVARPEARHQPPDHWHRHPLLVGTVLLPTDTNQEAQEHRFGQYVLRMDPHLGLVRRKDQH